MYTISLSTYLSLSLSLPISSPPCMYLFVHELPHPIPHLLPRLLFRRDPLLVPLRLGDRLQLLLTPVDRRRPHVAVTRPLRALHPAAVGLEDVATKTVSKPYNISY